MSDESPDTLAEVPETGDIVPEPEPEPLADADAEAPEAAAPEAPERPAAPPEAPSSDVAKYLRSLRGDETGGKYSRMLEGAYFRDREFVKAFPTVEEARNARMLLDGIGGLDGIEELQRAGELIAELDDMAARGDPELLNRLAGDNPEGFAGFTEAGLEKLRQTNREAYDRVLRPHVVSALTNTNLGFALRSAADILAAGNAQGAGEYLNAILGWLDGLAQEPRGARTPPQPAAAATAAAPPVPEFSQQLQAVAAPGVLGALKAAIAPYAQQRSLPEASRQRLENLVLSEIDRQLGADQQYQRTLQTLARGQNAERAAKFVVSKVDQVASRVTREVVNDLYPSAAARSATPAARGSAKTSGAARRPASPDNPGQPIMLSRGPRFEEVNWEHDPNRTLYLTHKAFLTDGRYVTWPK